MLRRLAQRRSALGNAIVVPVIDRLRGNPDRRDPRMSKLQAQSSRHGEAVLASPPFVGVG